MTWGKIAIVGGSVAGLSLAWALRRRGIEASVFERSSGLLAHQGAGVMLGASLVQNLQLTNVRPVTRRFYLGTAGQVLWEQSVEKYATGWSDVYRALRRHTAGVAVHENCPVERVALDPPRLCLFGHGQEPFDLIVGADGIGSVARACVDGNFAPRYLGYVALRGLVPRARLPEGLPATVEGLFDNAMAKLVMDGEHVTLYALPDEAEPLNWMWYVNIPERDLPHLLTDRNGQRHLWSLPPGALHAEIDDKMRAIARSRLPSWMNSLIDTTETLFLQPIYSGVAKRTTGSGVALVGDAAHLAVPHVGAGVTLAVEDSFTLAEIVAGGREDLEARLNVWAQERKAAVIARLAFAVRLGKSLQTGGKSWESWSQESYHAWWGSLLAGVSLDKSH